MKHYFAMGIFLSTFIQTLVVYGAAEKVLPDTLLLKDFKPKSVYNIPQTEIKKARFPVIDMHAHDYAKTDTEVKEWIRTMDAVGLDKAIILTTTTGAAFNELAQRYGPYTERFELWCGFDYTGYNEPNFGPAAMAELERCYRLGARGVGELGDKGKGLRYCRPTKAWGMHLDDPRMDPLLQKCAELGMPVSIHVADPYWMYLPMDAHNDGLMNAFHWRRDNLSDSLGHGPMLDILARAVARHPKTTFIACHFANCSHDLNQLGQLFDKYPNLYADISARFGETAPIPRFVAGFYTKYADRLVYGTDMGRSADMYRQTFRILETADEHFYDYGYHSPLHGFDLPEAVLQKVYRDNALRIRAPENTLVK